MLKSYLAEPHIYNAEATVLALIDGERPSVRLNQTYFHPQGGGQKGDVGFIGSVAVLDTKHAEHDEVDHFVGSLSGLEVGKTYPISVELTSRRRNAALHSAGHLIAALIDKAFPELKAVQGHHWPAEARVEFEGQISEEIVARIVSFLPNALDKALLEYWPITLCGDPFKTRRIKVGSEEEVPCGGTHVKSLKEIKSVTMKSIKKKGDRLRIAYEVEVAEV